MKLNKKFNLLLITSAIFLMASACSKPNHEETINKKTDNHIALISDINGIKDNSLNQSVWNGLKDYGTKNDLPEGNKGYNYFVPKDPKNYQTTINEALDKNFSTIIGVGYTLKPNIIKAAKNNPKKILLLLLPILQNLKI